MTAFSRTPTSPTTGVHSHAFARPDPGHERRTLVVVGLTALTMIVEVAAGLVTGSMALLADGWHMGTHVLALAIAVFAYRFARRHAANARFTFGTGKVGVLGGFASAVTLAIVAVLMAAESVHRLVVRTPIRFDEAILVALIGLLVNVVSALILDRGHAHAHARKTAHARDPNLKAAYLHVLADALTSVLAILALLAGKFIGLVWLDPAMGLVGGALIARWAWGLLRDTGAILLDAAADPAGVAAIRAALEREADVRILDLHVWKVGPGDGAAIATLVTPFPRSAAHYKARLDGIEGLSHITIEVISGDTPCPPPANESKIERRS